MSKLEPPASDLDKTASRVSPRTYATVAVAAGVPLAILVALYFLEMPLGQPHLKYRFSPVVPLRLASASIAILIGIGSLAMLLAITARGRRVSAAALVAGMAAWMAIVVWTFFAVPRHGEQHMVNLLSPSHDGAFVLESRGVESIRDYASSGFYERLQLEPTQMHGRRVLSNPPGMTFTALLCHRVAKAWPALHEALRDAYGLGDLGDPDQEMIFSSALLLTMWLTLVWGMSIVFSYRLCRLWLPPIAAAAVGFACVFNPSTLNFTPGKDPAQVTLVVAFLLCWMSAYHGKGRWWGVAAGIVFAASLTIGLIFVWIVAIVAAATLWDAFAERGRLRRWLANCAAPACVGAVGVMLCLYVVLDWNVALMTFRIGARYRGIQEGVIVDPFYLTLLGLPMFLLFVGPMFWAQLALSDNKSHHPANRIAGRLLLCTVAVMTFSYFFANNNETPRLWIPFIPLLLIPLAARRRAFAHDSASYHRLLVFLVAAQLVGTTLHWSLMDVRESEHRMITGRLWD